MKNMKIKTKLVAGFLLIALLTAVVGGVGIRSLRTMSSETQLLNARTTMAIISARLARNANQQRAAYLGMTAFDEIGDYDTADGYKETLRSLITEFDEYIEDLEARLTTEDGKRLLGNIKTSYAEFSGLRDEFVAVMDKVAASRVAVDEVSESEDGNTGASNSARKEVRESLLAVVDSVAPLTDAIAALTDFINDITDRQALDVADLGRDVTLLSAVLLFVALVAAVILGFFLANGISRPVNLMMGLLQQVGETGSLVFSDETKNRTRTAAQYKDEVSRSLAAFVKMMDQMVYYGEALETVASRDLTLRVKTLGAKDTIGNALVTMVNNLNEMFAEINTASEQVSGGSQQIANGAQSLAQGASEQAASVEQLSAAIAEVSASVRDAAASARNAAEMTDGIRSKAERGSEQMSAMMEAVQAINDASQNIGKVIKVIDDIAFQTNILALNAAVEAARAGAAGRGFAVVAEEVRNLAAKSAEAAQDTEALIENSINKAVLGVKIANETNESLVEIVDGIVSSSRIAGEIAESADRQYAAIGEINTGIDQVSQVVQQNSATAEESAAASEELSGQSSMLSNLIGQFKLRDASGPYLSHAREEALESGTQDTPQIVLDAKSYGGNYDKY
ncbi:MAG: methyl-accepting chemotaxis protein [Clostridiales Family XIII bacterium]|jgi:methyl-accepting chemotaxis protein|nr:methyl-accepting chemotaxis protein [Clostridiales Family XIII bacterium]